MGKLYVARAELTLAVDDTKPLRVLPMKPDPLSSFARAFAEVREDLGERAEVALDLMPVTAAQQAHRRRRVVAEDRTGRGSGWRGELVDAIGGGQPLGAQVAMGAGLGGVRVRGARSASPDVRRTRSVSLSAYQERTTTRALAEKLCALEPAFRLQVLVRASSEIKGSPQALLHALISCFEQFRGENWFKVSGRYLGVVHLGADVAWRRRRFDRRMDTGLFAPAEDKVVIASEVAGLVKPPTVHCRTPNVVRSGGVVPLPPQGLPTYTGQADLLPLGKVRSRDGERTVGVPLADTFFSYSAGRSRYGKALALDTPIPTLDGWTTMGEIQVGEVVFDERGEACTVVGTSQVMHGHDCYELRFSDGASVVADAGHLWRTWSLRARRSATERQGRSKTLDTMGGSSAHRGVSWHLPSRRWTAKAQLDGKVQWLGYFSDEEAAATAVTDFRQSHPASEWAGRPQLVTTEELAQSVQNGRHSNHCIEVAGALRCPDRDLVVDPYVLGAWLGDGASAHGGMTSADLGVIEEIRAAGYEVRKWGDHNGTRPYGWGVVGLAPRLRTLGVLGAKSIPDLYQRGSVKQRLALLEGLMDTDGSCSAAAGRCEFSSTKRELAEGVYQLVCGLGIKATLSTGRARLRGKDCGERFRVSFTPPFGVFRLGRKLACQRLEVQSATRTRRYIVAVHPVSSVPVRCISVDSPSHLYLAGRECIPTHNTEGAAVRFLALARAGHGCLFLDPHEDAITRMKPYLAGVGERVWEINLSARSRQAGWNPLAMEGCRAEDVEAKVSAMVSSFESAMSWGAVNNRALTLTTMAAQSLIELALVLPPDVAPTLFQMTSILANEEWRDEVVPHLSPASQDFWLTRFPRISPDAVTPVTNLIDRLRSSPAVAGLLGSSRSSYDIRRAMDTGAVVLACPAGTGDKDRLVANFFVYDMFRAAKSRKDTPAERRRPFHAFLDEVQTFDGASRGYLAALLEESGKYGMRLHLMSQQPTRLTRTTLDAVLTNRSHLLSTVVGYESARLLSKEWAGAVTPETITRLAKYTFLASVTLHGEVVPPFLVRGQEVSELFEAAGADEAAAMEEAIDANVGRRPIGETLTALDTLDRRILHHLRNRRSGAECSRGDSDEVRPAPRPDHIRFGVR